MWIFSLVMTDCPLSGRVQGHVSNFYILDWENFATASLLCTDVINKLVNGQHVDYTYSVQVRRGWMHKFIIRWHLVDCKHLTPLFWLALDLSYKLFLHRYAAVGKNLTDITSHGLSAVADRASCIFSQWISSDETSACD